MKQGTLIKKLISLSVFFSFFLAGTAARTEAAMSDYCVTPPFIVGGVTPNLLMLVDNSASMYDLAYIAGTTGATLPTYSCGGTVGDTQMSFCFDNTYDNTFSYEGYFDKDKYYQYNETPANNSSTPNAGTDKFIEIAILPFPCINQTAYLCVNATATTVATFAASGRFLNWLSSSKFDVEKKILTGGKYDTENQLLKSESRGCVGKRFVKVVPGINLTFAVRGPNALEPDFINPGTQGGENRIEIYAAVNPNMSDCQCAVANWTTGNFGQANTLTTNCLNVGTATSARHELSTFNHSMQTCWLIADNISNGATTDADIWNGVNLQDIKTACGNAYNDLYTVKNKPALADLTPNPGYITSLITNEASGNWMCTSEAIHNAVSSPYDVNGSDTSGFVGKCLNPFTLSGTNLNANWFADNTCFKKEILHYCFGSRVAEVTDPSIGTADSSETGNIPSVMMDSSVRSLGAPAGTFFARVAKASAPTGLIDTFSNQIRFGAMTFNTNGSKTECNPGGLTGSNIRCEAYCSATTTQACTSAADCPGGETCNTITKTDGGKIISYIGDPLGDHTTGLINTLDNITASSWTPFSEAFYSSIGYFAKADGEAYTTPPSFGTSRDFTLQAADYVLDKNPSQYPCQRNNILLITDGSSTADLSATPNDLAALYRPTGFTKYDTTNNCPKFSGSRSLDDLAWLAKERNIRSFSTSSASTVAPLKASEYIDTYVVYSGPLTSQGPEQCDPKTLMDATAAAGGTTAALTASNPSQLEAKLREAFQKIAAKTASGTAASVLASGEGSGANLIQALFYPKRRFGTTDIAWTGVLQNLWYYIDPYLGSSNIREDTGQDKTLKLDSDYILQYTFAQNETRANLYADGDGDGDIDSTSVPPTPTVSNVNFSDIKSLWEAGKLLFSRTPGSLNTESGARKIFTNYTNLDGSSTLAAFDTTPANVTLLQPKLNVTDTTEAEKLVKYIRGIDDIDGDGIAGDSNNDGANDDTGDTIDGIVVRNRTVSIDLDANGSIGAGETKTWKLGDIVNATPKIVSWVPLGLYDKAYLDRTYKEFISTPAYQARGTVFSGANDGMLHAFNLGLLGIYNDALKKATIGRICSTDSTKTCTADADCPSGTCDTDANLGQEAWSFIPKNALPYLKYFADKDYHTNECHIYYIDATPYIVDASINIDTDKNDDGTNDQSPAACNVATYSNYWECDKTKDSWRTVLIGGMKLGGACRSSSNTCQDCTKTPIAGTGYSTYFALDITDPNNPSLLWELSSEALGYSTSGPAIVRIGTKQGDTNTDSVINGLDAANNNKNGRWYAIFGSGPSGYVSPGTKQFIGITEHLNNNTISNTGDIKLFVHDLKSGTLLRTINAGEYAAFTGSLVNGAIDFDQNKPSSTGFYQDDAVYFGFTRRAALGSTATAQGGDVNHIQLASSSEADAEFYTGQFIHRNDGSHETKLITGYSGSAGTTPYNVTVDSNWKGPSPTSSTTYNIFPGWTEGGVMRLLTKQDLSPANWVVSKVIDNTGPVTAAVTKLQNYKSKNLRLFFGTGRYFYKANDVIDDSASQRRLYGVLEPCFTSTGIVTTCTTAVSAASMVTSGTCNATSSSSGTGDSTLSWCIDLDASSGLYSAERLVTDPLAATTGAVFFTTSSPAADICEYGGKSHLWAVKYDTGGSLAGTGVLKGKAIVQVSTGSIEEVDLNTAFTEREGRRSEPMQGLPPSGGLSIVVPPKPLNKILHMKKQ